MKPAPGFETRSGARVDVSIILGGGTPGQPGPALEFSWGGGGGGVQLNFEIKGRNILKSSLVGGCPGQPGPA